MKLGVLLADVKYRFADFENTSEYLLSRDISTVVVNSREASCGSLFIAIKGELFDGHEFVGEALERGASFCLCERLIEGIDKRKIILTEDTRRAAAWVFSRLSGEPFKKVYSVGITGTNGKTTVAEILSFILRNAGRNVCRIGTLGTEFNGEKNFAKKDTLTTPVPEKLYGVCSQAVDMGADCCVMEVSSHALALGRVEPVLFDIGMFLNLSRDHLDFHGDMESYFLAKCALVEKSRLFLVNFDDEYGWKVAWRYPHTLAFSADSRSVSDSRVSATAVGVKNFGSGGMEYLFYSKEAIFRIKTPMVGMYAVYNTMAAAFAALKMGISPVVIQGAIALFKGVKGRFEHVETDDGVTYVIDFAHTPVSLEGALKAAPRGHLAVLFGCGGERDRGKRYLMGRAAAKYSDFAIITSDNPRGEEPMSIIKEIERGFLSVGGNYRVICDREEAIRFAVRTAKPGDVVMICGKGHEDYIIDATGKHPFDERAVILDEASRKSY